MTKKPKSELADDLLVGAQAITEFLFGVSADRRRVYTLVEFERTFPAFYMGKLICARKSALTTWVSNLEKQKPKKRKYRRYGQTDTANHHADHSPESDPDASDAAAAEVILLKKKKRRDNTS